MTEKKFPTSVRLNEEEKNILKSLARYYGNISENDVIKLLLHEKAREVGLENKKADQGPNPDLP
jgi:hypothetical protein